MLLAKGFLLKFNSIRFDNFRRKKFHASIQMNKIRLPFELSNEFETKAKVKNFVIEITETIFFQIDQQYWNIGI